MVAVPDRVTPVTVGDTQSSRGVLPSVGPSVTMGRVCNDNGVTMGDRDKHNCRLELLPLVPALFLGTQGEIVKAQDTLD